MGRVARVAAMAGVLAGALIAAPAGASAADPRPQTIPALRIWSGGQGRTRLPRAVRIMVASGSGKRLSPVARLLASELRGRVIRSGPARAGDIVLSLGARDRRLGREGYALRIDRTVNITGRTPGGVFYGTRTLLQLLHQSRRLSRGRAEDWPRYPDRGLMIDLGRRMYPVAWIISEIKQLAYLKLNLLHLHLTDDQRWGIRSATHPEIVSAGALSRSEVKQILAVAARYHVTVVPEIDMPAHVGALLAAHPELELKAAGALSPPQSPDSRKLDISNPAALAVVKQLLDEYLPLFRGPYWDVGGDEYLTPAEEAAYPQLQLYAQQHYGPSATTKDAILGFFNWVDGIVRAHHRKLWAWHDELGGGTAVSAAPDIQASWWIDFSPLSEPRPPTPQQLLDAGHAILNDGWFPTYYTEDLGPIQGKPSMAKTYETWEVNQFCSPTENDQFFEPCYVVSSTEPRNLGSTINAWDDRELSLAGLRTGLDPPLMVLAQKTWQSPELTASYARFQRVMAAVGHRYT
ncbi:MAG TPA: beta-N-acetylhexosaminidase [Solirubrobacteraceae bacterium]|nr:beta-N-acetylhexosaminidase [Solirubrobacteraceae bacterium]